MNKSRLYLQNHHKIHKATFLMCIILIWWFSFPLGGYRVIVRDNKKVISEEVVEIEQSILINI